MPVDPVLQDAKNIALAQGGLAASPAERNGGETIKLCAASCIALAAIRRKCISVAENDFLRQLFCRTKQDYVPGLLTQIGFTLASARDVQMQNDGRIPSERLEWFMRYQAG